MYKFKNFVSLASLILSVLLFSSGSPIEAAKFGDNVSVSTASGDELHPDITVDHAGNIFVVWETATNGWDIAYAKSYTSGVSFISGGTVNAITVPAAGSATLDSAGGSKDTTLAGNCTECTSMALAAGGTTGIPTSGSGIVTTGGSSDDFSYTGIIGDALTGVTGLDEGVAHLIGDDVTISWAAGSSAVGNGSISVSYVGPWTRAGTVTVTYNGATWDVSGDVTSGVTDAGGSYPTIAQGPDDYRMTFSITAGGTAWGDGDRFTFTIAEESSSAYQTLPAITADDDLIAYFAWSDTRVATGVYDIYAAPTGLYAGDKYNYISQLTKIGPSYDTYATEEHAPAIAVEKYNGVKQVYIVWAANDDSITGTHIWFQGSSNEGDTFGTLSATRTQVDDEETAADICIQPSLATINRDDDNVRNLYVVWYNLTDDLIRYRTSADGGATWVATTLSVSDDAGVDQPSIAVSDTDKDGKPEIYVVWRQSADGHDNIYFSKLEEDASAFTTPVRVNASTDLVQDSPSIAVNPANGNLYVVWRDEKTGESDIYFSQSFDSGVNWGVDLNDDGDVSDSGEGIDLVVNDDTAYAVQNHPKIVADAYGHVYVVWEDARNASTTGYDIYSARLVAGTFAGGPAAPTSLSAVGADGSVSLTWTASTSADIVSYSVYRSTTRGSWSSTPTASSIVTTNYMDTGATNGTAYWYVVTATNASSQESGYSNDARATPNVVDTTAPSAPTGLSGLPASTQASLSWTAPSDSDLSTYHIYRSLASGTSYYYVDAVTSPITWYLDEDLTNGTTYYYVVTALDTSNNESADSNEVYVTPPSGYGTGTGTPPPAAPDAGEGGAGGGCFIATACFGTTLAREVMVLSEFRDEYLVKNILGKAFVKTYYRASPSAAEFISDKPLLKSMVRMQLKPWVKIANLFISVERNE